MEGTRWTKSAILFGLLAAGGIANAIKGPSHVGGVIAALVFGGIAARCWFMGG